MKVLITAAASAEAYKLKNTLNTDEVVLGDYNELPGFMGFIKLPNPSSDTYAHVMLTLCLDKGIDKLYLLTKAETAALSPSVQLFKEYNIHIATYNDL